MTTKIKKFLTIYAIVSTKYFMTKDKYVEDVQVLWTKSRYIENKSSIFSLETGNSDKKFNEKS